jgi:hypothetical protein
MESHSLGRTLPKIFLVILILLVAASGIVLAGPDHGDNTSGDGHQTGESDDSNHSGGYTWMISIAGLFAVVALPAAPAYWFGKQRNRISGVDNVHLAAIGLGLLSAAIHLYLFLEHGEVQMLLAGLGFLGGVGLFFAGVSRRVLYLLGIPYVAAQLTLWYSAGMPHIQSYGLLDKVAQVLLIGILGYLLWTE